MMQIPLNMSQIHLLSPEVVDQIAAGEVVERPSHLVKELVENSIDAKATRVHIEYSSGGRFVKVIDNGKGMDPEDLPKALERFATSKISKSDDLWHLHTFGFRGEALASISAVSKLTLISRRSGDEQAHQLISVYGKRQDVDKVGGSLGTTIVMENLFENTPARLKFLKSDGAEHTAIRTTLKAMALSHFEVEFRVQENGKLIHFWPACQSRQERVEQVLEIKSMFTGEAVREKVKAFAVFADPHTVAKTSKNMWLFVQNRWVQDRSLQAAVTEAYRNLLMHGEYPIAAVWVEAPTDFVDVNIHPTKSQVKFQDASLAFRAVAGALRSSLELAPWVPQRPSNSAPLNSSTEFERTSASSSASNEFLPEMPKENLSFEDSQLRVTQFQKKDFSPAKYSVHEPRVDYQALTQAAQSRSEMMSSLSARTVLNEGDLSNSRLDGEIEKTSEPVDVASPKSNVAKEGYWSSLEVLGQANLTYIVTQTRDKIIFVDQHAAHERVAFERLMSAWTGGKIDVQDFLFPLAIDMSPEKVEALLTLTQDVERLGVHIESLGPGTIGVKAAPLFIKEAILGRVLDQMAHEIVEQGGSYSLERAVGDICATMACHSVVRAGQALSLEQMKTLLQEMDLFPLSSFCPHGRPVSVEYPFYKLEKDFGRIV